MPDLRGRVENRQVTVLRDSGCSGAVVKAQFVEKRQYLGKDGYRMMMDKTIRKAPLARIIMVDTPFYKRDIQALCLPESIYDLIIGNIPLAGLADKPDPMWTVASCKAQKEDKKEDNRKEDNRKEDNQKKDNQKKDNQKDDNQKDDNQKEDNQKEDNRK